MKLYSFWRSTTSIRVRAVLNLKGIDYDIVPVNLLANEQRTDAFLEMNPGQGVPVLALNDGTHLSQSLAIIDYLDAQVSDPPMLPGDPLRRNKVLAAALTLAMDVHPVNNLRVTQYLTDRLGRTEEEVAGWMRHWTQEGLTAFARLIDAKTPFCFGQTPDLADVCLLAQLYNARRWVVDLSRYERLVEIDARLQALPAIRSAMPDQQPDAAKEMRCP